MSALRDGDGMTLLTNDEVAVMAGVKSFRTINHYNAQRRRGRGGKPMPRPIPPPVRKVRMELTRADGKPVTIWKELWREDDIRAWIVTREADYPGKRG